MTWLARIRAEEPSANRTLTFTLDWQGWICDVPDLEPVCAYLTAAHGLADYSPSEGVPGARQASAAAAWLRGWPEFAAVRIELPPPVPVLADTFY